MNKFTFWHVLAVLFHFLLRFVTPVFVLIGVIFAKKSDRVTKHYGQDQLIQRYVLPRWLNWFNSPDEDGWPMYEPTVAKIYHSLGWRVALFYNLAFRNQAQGFLWLFGHEVTELVRNKNKEMNCTLLNKELDLKLFALIYGWEVAHDHYKTHTKTGYFAIPQIEISR